MLPHASDSDRFSLLLLADGELLLDDLAVEYVFTSSDSDGRDLTPLVREDLTGYGGSQQGRCILSRYLESAGRRYREGRLRVGSRSLFFDADDWRCPIIRIEAGAVSSAIACQPLNSTVDSLLASLFVAQQNLGIAVPVVESGRRVGVKIQRSRGSSFCDELVSPSDLQSNFRELFGSQSDANDTFAGGRASPRPPPNVQASTWLAVTASSSSLLRENGADHPYVDLSLQGTHWFRPLYADVEVVLDLVLWLQRIHALPSRRDRQKAVREAVHAREEKIYFDLTYLDPEAVQGTLLDEPCDTITALSRSPGRVRITTLGLHVMPIHGNAGGPVQQIPMSALKSIRRLQYSIQDCALELGYTLRDQGDSCLRDSKERVFTIMLAFKSNAKRERAYSSLCARISLDTLQTFERKDIDRATNRWRLGELCNFDYLMYLNYAAGRSFNDLSQYPVFPWIIEDYDSDILDLTNESTFRDLSRPIGALNEERLAVFEERYNEMPPPRFFYGTHYSAPAYVINFLLRAAPAAMLRLQNGSFDTPDRLFGSIRETWKGVLTNQADVKELIPEFFAIKEDDLSAGVLHTNAAKGEFLENVLNLDLGIRQDGKRVDAVELPRWANGRSDTFVFKNREALESDYVSRHVHRWIDLIFGCNAGDPKAKNVFYTDVAGLGMEKFSAEDVDVDEDVKGQLETIFLEFGRTPKQLFRHPHPERYSESRHSSDVAVQEEPAASAYTPCKACISAESKPDHSCDKNNGYAARNVFDHDQCFPGEPVESRGKRYAVSGLELFHSPAFLSDKTVVSIEMRRFGTIRWDHCLMSGSSSKIVDFDVFPTKDVADKSDMMRNCGIVISLSSSLLQVYVDSELRRSKNIDQLSSLVCCGPETVVLGTLRGDLFAYDITSGRCESIMRYAHASQIVTLAYCAEVKALVSVSLDATIAVWKIIDSESPLPTLFRVGELDGEDPIINVTTCASDAFVYVGVKTELARVLAWQIPTTVMRTESGFEALDPVVDISLSSRNDAVRSDNDRKSRDAYAVNRRAMQQICWILCDSAEPMLAASEYSCAEEYVVKLWGLHGNKVPASEIVTDRTRRGCIATGIDLDTLLVASDGVVSEYDCTGILRRRFTLDDVSIARFSTVKVLQNFAIVTLGDTEKISFWKPSVA